MENASKALIIAGAILLSILIIGLGMAVYNNASATQGKANLSSQEISAHNATFEAYEGRIKGSQVRALLNAIAKNNEEYEDRKISVTLRHSTSTASLNYTRVAGPAMLLAATGGPSEDGSLNDVNDPDQIKGVLTEVKNSTTYQVDFTWGGLDGLIDKCAIYVYGTTAPTTTP